jgi:hypothetical protein
VGIVLAALAALSLYWVALSDWPRIEANWCESGERPNCNYYTGYLMSASAGLAICFGFGVLVYGFVRVLVYGLVRLVGWVIAGFASTD